MKKLLMILCGITGVASAAYVPNTINFTCPDGKQVDLAQKVDVSVGERPGGIGECFWRNPVTSFSVSQDGTSITGLTTWTLDGGWLADGCSDIKGENMTSVGVIARVSCKTQQQ
jgi:hypothetical protein